MIVDDFVNVYFVFAGGDVYYHVPYSLSAVVGHGYEREFQRGATLICLFTIYFYLANLKLERVLLVWALFINKRGLHYSMLFIFVGS